MLTELKYRTFNELLEDVSVDFSMYALENMIEPQQLIKVVQRVNYDLGLRIFMTKQVVLDISHRKVRLPDDFYVLNYALLCGEYSITQPAISGTHREDQVVIPSQECNDPCSCGNNNCGTSTTTVIPGTCPSCVTNVVPTPSIPSTCNTCLTQCGTTYQIIQKTMYETRNYEVRAPIRLNSNSKTISCDCPNTKWESPFLATLNGGFLMMNLDSGKVYVNYQGALEDEEGNLLVLDNPTVNEYYEYALKQRILENLYMNGEDVVQKLNLIEQRYRAARNNALSLVNTPNFSEMKKMHDMNRKAMYGLYYDMFRSYNYNSWR